MDVFLHRIFKGDRIIWMVMAGLCCISLIEVFSALGADSFRAGSHFMPIIKHGVILLAGVVMTIALHNFDYKKTLWILYPMLLASVILLILTLITGKDDNEAQRWLNVFGFQFQPSELAKATMVLFAAWKLGFARPKGEEAMDKAFWEVLILTGIFAALIVTQNMSTALIICVFSYLMMFIAGVSRQKMIRLTIVVAVVGAVLLVLLISIPKIEGVDRWATWHHRLTTSSVSVRDPQYAITDENMQQHYAKIAISEGLGLGVFPGNSSQRDFLPEAFNDFIYAIIIEDMGWIGLFLVPFLYIILLIRCAVLASKCRRPVPTLLILGPALLIGMQAFINMGVAVGLLPVTGQPLPLISKGGTSQLVTCFYFALILSVSRFNEALDEQEVLAQEAAEDAALEAAAREEALQQMAESHAAQQEMDTEDYASMAE